MTIEKLLYNPEKYRDGENYCATNLVFPVLFEGQRYVVKQVRPVRSLLTTAYYALQDRYFLGTRRLASPWLQLEIEAQKLRHLQGKGTPKLIYFHDLLVREYLPGLPFRHLKTDQQRQQTLEGALAALEEIHEQDVVVGDAQVKNTISSQERVCWLDLEGLFDESDLVKSKAIDVLKFVYSAYTATRDHWIVLSAAELVAKRYENPEVRQRIQSLASQINAGPGLWFSMRLPQDGRLHREIRLALSAKGR